MNKKLIEALLHNETDLDSVRERFGDMEFYHRLLRAFLEDTTVFDLEKAIFSLHWDDAFTYAHALKGLAINLGFIPLYHSVGEMVISIRSANTEKATGQLLTVKRYYNDIILAIKNNED